jgi:PAS domain-containing protein
MKNSAEDKSYAKELREQAEEKLSKMQPKGDKKNLNADYTKLQHELSVHEIELEMQNEDLRNLNNSLEMALKKYTMMYDFAPMGFYTLNEKGIIEELNFAGAEILGEKRFSLINSIFRLYVSEDSRPVFDNFLKMVYLSKSKKMCKVNIGNDSHHLTTVCMEAIVISNNKCLLSVLDTCEMDKRDIDL